jgi:hypothetical protein
MVALCSRALVVLLLLLSQRVLQAWHSYRMLQLLRHVTLLLLQQRQQQQQASS